MSVPRVAVIGAGWSGLTSALDVQSAGAAVTLFDMAHHAGGRARSLSPAQPAEPPAPLDVNSLDNGQHIMIGAYQDTLALMSALGVNPETHLLRLPLALLGPDGQGLRLGVGHPVLQFTWAVLRHPKWSWRDKWQMLREAGQWMLSGFQCSAELSVAQLTAAWSPTLRADIVDPLCVAALNTHAPQASAQVFLRVLQDALFSGRGASDLLLPRRPLSELVGDPATHALLARGAQVHWGHRVHRLAPCAEERGWLVDEQHFDAVILACTAREAARLILPWNPSWAQQAQALTYEPITTVYLRCHGGRLPAPMLALPSDDTRWPAQFVFDLSQVHTDQPPLWSMVISGAQQWVDQGQQALAEAALAQCTVQLAPWLDESPQLVRVLTEKRATFACTPGLLRPRADPLPGLWVAGDFIDGPYPATLEGAVRSGLGAAHLLKKHFAM